MEEKKKASEKPKTQKVKKEEPKVDIGAMKEDYKATGGWGNIEL